MERFDLDLVAVGAKGEQAPLIGAENGGMPEREAFEYVWMRVVKLILVTIRDESEAWTDLIEKLGGGGCPAAVVAHF